LIGLDVVQVFAEISPGKTADRRDPIVHLRDRLSWLEAQLPDDGSGFIPGTLAVQDVFFVSGIRFAEARPIGVELAWSRYPRLKALTARLDQRPSFKANPIWWWDPKVLGYRPGGSPLYDSARPSNE